MSQNNILTRINNIYPYLSCNPFVVITLTSKSLYAVKGI